jgi:hypothetical protein
MKASNQPHQISLSDTTIAKCDATNQFENFDRMFRSVISVPKTVIAKEEAKWKRTRKKQAKK